MTGHHRGTLWLLWVVLTGTAVSAWSPGVATAWADVDAGQPLAVQVDPPVDRLEPADRDLLIRVRLTGMLVAPAGRQAQERAASESVKEIGGRIATEYFDLDEEVRTVSAQLGLPLPDQPDPDHLAWLEGLSRTSGDDFDRTFVSLLRGAYAEFLPIIFAARVDTRNELVRSIAETAAVTVMRHMGYLESSGLVDFASLPQPGVPVGAVGTVDVLLVWVVLGLAAIATIAALIELLRPREPVVGLGSYVPPMPGRTPVAGRAGSGSAGPGHLSQHDW